jgi:probable rRNA maturation factor
MVSRPTSSKRRRRPPIEGGLEVFVADEQSDHPVDVARWSHLAEQVLEAQGVHGDAELSVLFVDAEVMTGLNRRFMEADGPTDVLSFPLDDDLIEMGRWPDASTTGPDRGAVQPDDAPLLLGDVVICPEVAARNAPEHAGSYEDEVALLVVHGVLHVLGLDHVDDTTTAAMQARERELLEALHGPLQGDPWASPPP